jgi:hypothetical protein
MTSTVSRFSSIQDTAEERWSRLYVDVRASYGRASIQSALFLNGGAAVALLAFLGNLAIAQQTKGLTGNFVIFKEAFVCFGVGVMLAGSANVVAFLIQVASIAHPKMLNVRLFAGLDLSESESSSHRSFFSQRDHGWRLTE